MHPVATQIGVLRDELNAQFQERNDTIEACLLALVSGQHAFLLGPPGTAKTLLIRAIVHAIKNGRYAEFAMSQHSTLESFIGPLDILHFRKTGEYRYNREGYITDVEIGMVNEIGKMADDLGHATLALFNERLIHEVREIDGQKVSVHPAPLMTAYCDSNEELTLGSDHAAALFDRLLYRDEVQPIREGSNFVKMLKGGDPVITAEIDIEDLKDVVHNVVPSIGVAEHVYTALTTLRHELDTAGVKPSGRRWHWSITALKASAFLAGRDQVTEDDIASLRFTLWDTVDQRPKVAELCLSKSNPFIGPLLDVRKRIHELKDGIETRQKAFVDSGSDWEGAEGSALQMYGKEVTKKLEQVRTELDAMLLDAQGRPIPTFREMHDLQQAVLVQNFMICLGQDKAQAKLMAEKPARLGQGDGGNV